MTERIEVNVVNVDVAVTDRHDHPVHGLKGGDFEVYEDGVLQTITNFYVVESAKQRRDEEPAAEDRFRRKVMVIIDSFHSTKLRRDRALARLEEFIDDRFRGGEYEWSIAVVGRSLHPVLLPTSDKTTVHRALDAIRSLGTRGGTESAFKIDHRDLRLGQVAMPSRFTVSPDPKTGAASGCDLATAFAQYVNGASQAMLARDSASAILDAERAFASESGKKIILLLTGDLALGDLAALKCKHEFYDFRKAIIEARDVLVREANASNVSLYIINTEGLESAVDVSVNDWAPLVDTGNMDWIASETGGRFFPGNSVGEALSMFDAVSSNFYSLGYRPKHGDDGRYHRIAVRIRKSNARLQYRDGYASASFR